MSMVSSKPFPTGGPLGSAQPHVTLLENSFFKVQRTSRMASELPCLQTSAVLPPHCPSAHCSPVSLLCAPPHFPSAHCSPVFLLCAPSTLSLCSLLPYVPTVCSLHTVPLLTAPLCPYCVLLHTVSLLTVPLYPYCVLLYTVSLLTARLCPYCVLLHTVPLLTAPLCSYCVLPPHCPSAHCSPMFLLCAPSTLSLCSLLPYVPNISAFNGDTLQHTQNY